MPRTERLIQGIQVYAYLGKSNKICRFIKSIDIYQQVMEMIQERGEKPKLLNTKPCGEIT